MRVGCAPHVVWCGQAGTYCCQILLLKMYVCVRACREEVASCSEKAYERLRVTDAARMLMLGSEAEVRSYAQQVPMHACMRVK